MKNLNVLKMNSVIVDEKQIENFKMVYPGHELQIFATFSFEFQQTMKLIRKIAKVKTENLPITLNELLNITDVSFMLRPYFTTSKNLHVGIRIYDNMSMIYDQWRTVKT